MERELMCWFTMQAAPDLILILTHVSTFGDTASFSEHATHVAGIVGGSGANSAAQGGTALQWRGMAPNVDLISYGIGSVSGIIFYEDTADIETDWAAAQNSFGADIGTGGLSSSIYDNYPSRCDLWENMAQALSC